MNTTDTITMPAATKEEMTFDCEMCGAVVPESLMHHDGWGQPICYGCFHSIAQEVEPEAIYGEADAPDPMVVAESYAIEFDTTLSGDEDDFRDVESSESIHMSAEW